MTDLHYLSATEALAMFRTKELSPVELMTAVIERAQAVEPVINAFAATHFDEALAAARQAESRYAGNGEAQGRWTAFRSRSRRKPRSRARATRSARCRCVT